jgi:hypothetical protein
MKSGAGKAHRLLCWLCLSGFGSVPHQPPHALPFTRNGGRSPTGFFRRGFHRIVTRDPRNSPGKVQQAVGPRQAIS